MKHNGDVMLLGKNLIGGVMSHRINQNVPIIKVPDFDSANVTSNNFYILKKDSTVGYLKYQRDNIWQTYKCILHKT